VLGAGLAERVRAQVGAGDGVVVTVVIVVWARFIIGVLTDDVLARSTAEQKAT
jgi:hypothetical protein